MVLFFKSFFCSVACSPKGPAAGLKKVKEEPRTPRKKEMLFGRDISILSPETRRMALTLADTPHSRELVAQLCELSEPDEGQVQVHV